MSSWSRSLRGGGHGVGDTVPLSSDTCPELSNSLSAILTTGVVWRRFSLNSRDRFLAVRLCTCSHISQFQGNTPRIRYHNVILKSITLMTKKITRANAILSQTPKIIILIWVYTLSNFRVDSHIKTAPQLFFSMYHSKFY